MDSSDDKVLRPKTVVGVASSGAGRADTNVGASGTATGRGIVSDDGARGVTVGVGRMAASVGRVTSLGGVTTSTGGATTSSVGGVVANDSNSGAGPSVNPGVGPGVVSKLGDNANTNGVVNPGARSDSRGDTGPARPDDNYGASDTLGDKEEGSEDDFYESFRRLAAPVSSEEGDIILNNGRRKRKGLIIGIIVAAACVVIGLVVFLLVGLPAMDAKTGDGIKARNYEEAFNIYANYFLFGKKGKEAVDWDATKEEGFESYFRKVVDKPYEVKEIVDKEETGEQILDQFVQRFEDFDSLYLRQKKKTERLTATIDDYQRKLRFINKYYNIGLPIVPMIFEDYINNGYDGAEEKVWEIADSYESVGEIYDENVVELVGRYGSNQLSLIEEYSHIGCIIDNRIDSTCVNQNGNDTIIDYTQRSEAQWSDFSSLCFNAKSSVSNTLKQIYNEMVLIKESEEEN